MNMQTSRSGLCCLMRLISLIALNILVLIMNAIGRNDLSTNASSQKLIFTTYSSFPSSNQTSSITAASSRQEVFQIAHGAGNDTYALLMGNDRSQISLVNTNFFTHKNLSHIGLYDHIAPLEAQVFDVNNTKTNTQLSEIIDRSTTRLGDVPSSKTKIKLSDDQRRYISLKLNMPSLMPSGAASTPQANFVEIDINAIKDDVTPLTLPSSTGVFGHLADEKDAITFAGKQDKETLRQFILGLGGEFEENATINELAPVFATALTQSRFSLPSTSHVTVTKQQSRADFRSNQNVVDIQQTIAAIRYFIPEVDFRNSISASTLGDLAVSAMLTVFKPQLKLVQTLDELLRVGQATDTTGVILRMRTVLFREAVAVYEPCAIELMTGVRPVGTILFHCVCNALTVDNRNKNADYYLQALKLVQTGAAGQLDISTLSQYLAQAKNDFAVSRITPWTATALNDALFLGDGPLHCWAQSMAAMTPALAQILISNQLKAAKGTDVTDADITTMTSALKTEADFRDAIRQSSGTSPPNSAFAAHGQKQQVNGSSRRQRNNRSKSNDRIDEAEQACLRSFTNQGCNGQGTYCNRQHFDASSPVTVRAANLLYGGTTWFKSISDIDPVKVTQAGLDYAKLLKCLKNPQQKDLRSFDGNKKRQPKNPSLSSAFGAKCANNHCLSNCNGDCPCATGTGTTCGQDPLTCLYVNQQLVLKSVTPNEPLAHVALAILKGSDNKAAADHSPFTFAVATTVPTPKPSTITAMEAREILAASITDAQKDALKNMSADDFKANIGSVLGLL